VDVNVGGNQSCFRKTTHCREALMVFFAKAFDPADSAVVNTYQWILNYSGRPNQSSRRYRADHRHPFATFDK
jgi:hypothetical protein